MNSIKNTFIKPIEFIDFQVSSMKIINWEKIFIRGKKYCGETNISGFLRELMFLMASNKLEQALYAIVFSLGFAFEVKTRMIRTQITYFNPISG